MAYLSFNTHQLLEGYYGVVQAGAIVMPLNVRLSVAELIGILNHSGARIVIYEADFETIAQSLKSACPLVEKWITTAAGPSPAADLTYEELMAEGTPERVDILTIDEHAIAELFYTSGSTGTPKGVTHTNRTLYLHALSVAGLYARFGDDGGPAHHSAVPRKRLGRPQASVMMGVKQVMVRRFEPTFVFKLIEQHTATDMSLVPTMANALINAPDLRMYDTSSMRRIMVGGAAASRN